MKLSTRNKIAAGIIIPVIGAMSFGLGGSIANAAVSPDATTLCTMPAGSAKSCTISYSFGAVTAGVTEGTTVKGLIEGAPGTTIDYSIFRLSADDAGKVTMTKISEDVSATVNSSGFAEVDIPVPVMKAPDTGAVDAFIIQPSDSDDPQNLIAMETFSIASHRAQVTEEKSKPLNGEHYGPNELITYALGAGIEGDQYVLQLKKDGEWVDMSDRETTGKISDLRVGTLSWTFGDLATGDYEARISNVEDLENPIEEFTFSVVNENAPTPTPIDDQTPTPTPTEEFDPQSPVDNALKATDDTYSLKVGEDDVLIDILANDVLEEGDQFIKDTIYIRGASETQWSKTVWDMGEAKWDVFNGKILVTAPGNEGFQSHNNPTPIEYRVNTTSGKTYVGTVTLNKAPADGETPTPTPTPTGNETPTPTPTPTDTVDSREATDLVNVDGALTPTYKIDGNIMKNEGMLVDADGKPIANVKVSLYDYTGEKRGALLGEATTDANGKFAFDATLPEGWDANKSFNAELTFEGNDDYKPVSAYMELVTDGQKNDDTKPDVTKEDDKEKPSITTGGDPSTDPTGAIASVALAATAGGALLRRKFNKNN